LYRAIDSKGATIDFLLSALRDADAAKRLFRKALSDRSHPQPRVINTDLAPTYSSAIPDSKKEGTLRRAQHGSVRFYVLELAAVDLHDHVNGDHSQEIQAAMPRVGGRS
jgi:transposase-like protein